MLLSTSRGSPNARLAQALLVALGLVLVGLSMPRAAAAEVRLSLGELDAALDDQLDGDVDALETLLADTLRSRLADADVELADGTLVFDNHLVNRDSVSGCTETLVRYLDTRITLEGDTALALDLVSLDAPMRLSFEVRGRIAAEGRARQRFGVRVGSCRTLATDNFDVTASGPFALRLALTVELRPEFAEPDRLRFRPSVTLDGDLLERDIDVDVDDSLLESLIENLLLDVIEDAFAPTRIEEALRDLRADLERALDDELDDGAVEVTLPAPDDTQVIALYDLFAPERPLELTIGHLQARRTELLAAALLGDDAMMGDLLADAATCEALGLMQVPLVPAAAWSLESGACEALRSEPSGPGLLYGDAACATGFAFEPTSLDTFCVDNLDTLRYGNAADLPPDDAQPLWTLSPATRLELGARPLTQVPGGAAQPWTTRLRYRTVETERGRCELEMRVHTAQPAAGGAAGAPPMRPLLALHGGSWSARSTGALGLEASVLPLTSAGFVVFAPFYRLIGDREGPPACNGASLEEVERDAQAALDWVLANAARFGADGRPVVFGQSAGGHLAASLAFSRADDVERAALLYAPVDFADFVQQAAAGAYADEAGRRILERVLDGVLESIDVESAMVQRNSFPRRVIERRAAGQRVPPLFLVHGELDELLPFRQSVRLCNALAGDVRSGPAPLVPALEELRRIVACDASSALHLIAEGEHALDLCVAEGLCASGSPESAELVADTLQRLVDWAAATEPTAGSLPGGGAPEPVGAGANAAPTEQPADGGTAERPPALDSPPGAGAGAGTPAGAGAEPADLASTGGGGTAGWLTLLSLLLGLGLRRLAPTSPVSTRRSA